MLSQPSKYALRALIYLQAQPEYKYVRVEEIAEATRLPPAYLSKIIKKLTTAKVILSRRGKNGGVQINHEQGPVSFFDVCNALEDPMVKSECVLFKKPCNPNDPCSFHREWSKSKEKLLEFLKYSRLD